MVTTHDTPISYQLPLGDELVSLNQYIGKPVSLEYLGNISCTHCGRDTKKSFNQGYCYPCFRRLAQCDTCIMSPEKCHYHLGTCREPEWGETWCMQDHYVYLANSSGIKVGITRGTQIPTRWMDQGAIQALPIARVKTRYQSGLLEVVLKKHVTDRTNWRAMLKGGNERQDLVAKWSELRGEIALELAQLRGQQGEECFELLDQQALSFDYPVNNYPLKVSTHNLDKNPLAEGILEGIKGQYLILDTGVINIRKYTAYHVAFSA
ncbi:MAG: DUF2797 domain-containing protein [Pseudomonadales bacterium]